MKSFIYKGLEFRATNLDTRKMDFFDLSKKCTGDRLITIEEGWNWKEFYETAEKCGYSEIDVFECKGEHWIPMGGGLMGFDINQTIESRNWEPKVWS